MVTMFLNPLDSKSAMAPGQYPVLQSLPLPVISVGRDRSLLVFRQHALDEAGIAARTMLPEEAERLVHDPHPRVWVFCASIEISTLIYLACTVRRNSPGSRLLLVERCDVAGIERSLFHQVICKDTRVEQLTAAVRRYLAIS
jgi:hypothetical protein